MAIDDRHSLIITVNERLSKQLEIQRLMDANKKVDSPVAVSLQSFISKLWHELGLHIQLPRVLSAELVQLFFERVVRETSPELMDAARAAKKASSAFDALINWNVAVDKVVSGDNLDVQAFLKWEAAFRNYCKNQNVITASQRIQVIIDNLDKINLPKALKVSGFDDIPPHIQLLLDALMEAGVLVEIEPMQAFKIESVALNACASIPDEITHALKYASTFLKDNPAKTMAIVIPSLHSLYPILHRLCYEMLDEPYTISGGFALGEYPLISQALVLISTLGLPVQSVSAHLKGCAQYLKSLNWPSETTLSSQNHQIVQAFFNVLQTLSCSSEFLGEQSFTQTLQLLRQYLNKPFQGEDNPASRLSILGLLEAAPLSFDAIWVCDVCDDVLPAKPDPNPYLPYALQVENDMPKASAARELTLAQNLLSRICAQNKKIIMSYSKFQEGVLKSKSGLLKGFKESHLAELPSKLQLQYVPESCEFLADFVAPSLSDSGKSTLHGGANIFVKQSACPFQAFASVRLSLNPPEEDSEYLDAKERGIVLHDVLENIWKQLNTQANLLALSEAALNKIILDYVKKALCRYSKLKNHHTYYKLELERLSVLIHAWMSYEKSRPPFEVRAHEKEIVATIVGLPITIRIDRVDKLNTGETLLIDYKTGRTNINSWLSDRLSAPQLPLYATILEVDGISFADLSGRELAMKGIAKTDLDIPGVVPPEKIRGVEIADFKTLVTCWREKIEALARAFLNGDASVDPDIHACRYCGLDALCRKDEVTQV